MTPQNQDLGGRSPSLPESESGQRDQIDQQPQNYLESRDHGFMMPHRHCVGIDCREYMRTTNSVLLGGCVNYVHRAQLQRDGMSRIYGSCFDKLARYCGFCRSENHPGLLLALSLRLA